MNSLIIKTKQGKEVAVSAVLEVEPGRCVGCCFGNGVYSDPTNAFACNAVRTTSCSTARRIYIPATDEGRAAYVAAKMVRA